PLFVGATPVGTNCNGLSTTGTPATLVDPALVNGGQFPKESTTFQRFNVIGRYYVDPTVRQQMGFKGDAGRGWGWGSGPGTSAGFGTFEGALPRYPLNSFPNWYGDCVNWGHYSATGSAHW